jgi:hypothetical protein|tara:strand:- start:1988 stop:2248 length:261 start_codon:yes stop_codon:yes gene_type:complete
MGLFKWLADFFGAGNDNVSVPAKAPAKKVVDATIDPQPKVAKLTAASLSKLTKADLELKGREFGVELDKRKKKDVLVAEVLKASKK